MSIIHFTLAIMMIIVERRAIQDGENADAHAATHVARGDHQAPATHLLIPDGETSFLGLNEQIQMKDMDTKKKRSIV